MAGWCSIAGCGTAEADFLYPEPTPGAGAKRQTYPLQQLPGSTLIPYLAAARKGTTTALSGFLMYSIAAFSSCSGYLPY